MLGSSAAFRAEGAARQGDQIERPRDADGPGRVGQGNGRPLHPRPFGRASAPFVTVTSATIEPDRMEEVLFGRETAESGVEPGLLEQAHGGVVYFDEVADMPPGTQSKILRVLVEQQFTASAGPTRCGSTCGSSPRPRAICAARSPRAASGRNFMTG
jgi:two-component system, NtrC family, nitrogen regulation response regulator NtrX